jgi:hypothetical protein
VTATNHIPKTATPSHENALLVVADFHSFNCNSKRIPCAEGFARKLEKAVFLTVAAKHRR